MTAVCGEDFCERCGDCLACYGDENCWDGGMDNGSHIWPEPDEFAMAQDAKT